MLIIPIENLDPVTTAVIIIIALVIIVLTILASKALGVTFSRRVRVNAFVTAIVVIIGVFATLFSIDFFLSSFFGYGTTLSYIFSTPIVYFFLLIFAICLVIGSIIPGNIGKATRIISYIALFVFLLFVEIQIIKPFLKRTEVNLQECTNFFSPSQTTGNVVYDLLTYSSCILSGYVPKDLSIIGWATFIIFYIILPFGFIWIFVYALMKDIFSGWGTFDRYAPVLSFIVAMYGARVLFGAILLEFFAYGAWGLAGIFIAILLVKGLEKLIENRFAIEEYANRIRETLKTEKDVRHSFASAALGYVTQAENLTNFDREGMLWGANLIANITGFDDWKYLPDNDKNLIRGLLLEIRNAAKEGNVNEYLNKVRRLKNLLLTWLKIK